MTPWTVARQAPLSVGFPRQEYWSGLPFPSPGDLPNPGNPRLLHWQAGFFFLFFFLPLSHWGNSAGLLGVSQIFQTLSCFHAFSQATQSLWDSPPCLLTWLTSASPLEAHQLRAVFSKTHLSPAPLGEQAGLVDPPTYFPSIRLPDRPLTSTARRASWAG